MWMSKDGHLLLHASFNDTLVQELKFPWYGVNEELKLYPEIRSLRYPKVCDAIFFKHKLKCNAFVNI